MNLSEPLDGLTTAVEAAVLRVLARSDVGFSGRQIHNLAGVGSTSSVHRALGNLVQVGIVRAEPRPPAIIYRANREHVLWPAVELGLTSRQRAFDGIRDFCEHAPDAVPDVRGVTVLVYGSVARRESTIESDIDLFVVYPDEFDPEERAGFSYLLGEYVERVTGNEAQVFAVDRAEVRQRLADNDALLANVITDGIHLFGPPVTDTGAHAA